MRAGGSTGGSPGTSSGPLVLGIETATELVGVAVGDAAAGVHASLWAVGRRRHAEALGPALEQVLALAERNLSEVGAVAVDVGPGLFTGLRVGVATAQGLGEGLGVGVLGLTSLEVLAVGAAEAGHAGAVLAVVDARRGEVFAQRFDLPGDGSAVARGEPSLQDPAAVVTGLAEEAAGHGHGRGLLVVGDGGRRYAEKLSAVPGVSVAGPGLVHPLPATLVRVAATRLAAGLQPLSPELLRPRYLRQADARIHWAQRPPAVPRPT